jgi:hypothetical protein
MMGWSSSGGATALPAVPTTRPPRSQPRRPGLHRRPSISRRLSSMCPRQSLRSLLLRQPGASSPQWRLHSRTALIHGPSPLCSCQLCPPPPPPCPQLLEGRLSFNTSRPITHPLAAQQQPLAWTLPPGPKLRPSRPCTCSSRHWASPRGRSGLAMAAWPSHTRPNLSHTTSTSCHSTKPRQCTRSSCQLVSSGLTHQL